MDRHTTGERIAADIYAINRAEDLARAGYQTAEQAAHQAEQEAYRERARQVKADEDRRWAEKEAARLKAEEDEASKVRAAAQQRADAGLKAELRRRYMGNPAATEADFEEAYPTMRRQYLQEQAMDQGGSRERETAALRQRYQNL